MEVVEQLGQEFPIYRRAVKDCFDKALEQSAQNNSRDENHVLCIPVVFHVIWNTEEQNIHDYLIQEQLKTLNADFRKLNTNISELREGFKSIAADTRIQFHKAETDPWGNPTNGITRRETSLKTFQGWDWSSNRNRIKSFETGGFPKT